MRLWKQGFLEKWQSFHSFQLSALRIVEISKPKFFFHKNLMSVVRIVCQKILFPDSNDSNTSPWRVLIAESF